MSVDVVRVLTGNLKLVAVGVGAVALLGGTATTVSLVDSATPTRNTHATAKPADTDEDDAEGKGGARPTDTHGYCVSTAVAKAHQAGKTGRDVAAAAHSCAKPKAAAGAANKGAKKAAKPHGRSAAAPGQQPR